MDYSQKNTCQLKIPVFYPTMEEFKNFPNYIDYMESQGAHKAGLAKVVPPKGWTPRKDGYDDVDLLIPAPIRQVASGNKGLFQQLNIQTKPMTVKEFAKLANSPKYAPPKGDIEELERKFWKNVTFNAPIYAADISGTIYDPEQRVWNVGNLGTILDLISSAYNARIEGVNTAYLYFGMWKTSFCWHTEDMDLYSINYLHYGAPKFWYVIPPQNGRRFERLAEGFFPGEVKRCPAFLRHKMTHISPHVLKRYSIPYDTIVQKTGEFMITFPYAYHAGFNLGYNCAESTNFASRRWIDYGKNCSHCTCSEDMVRIDMDCFVKTYQPSRYELWKQGQDRAHPEDQGKRSATVGKSARDSDAQIPSCSFGTVLSNDNSISESSKITRKVSRRHPVISLDDDADLEKASLQSGKHKLDDDDDVDEDKGVTSENKRFKKIRQTAAESGRSNLPGCSKSLQKFLSAVSSTSSDDESRSSDASRRSRSFKKDSNDKNIKQKRTSSFKEQTDVEQFMGKVLAKVPELIEVGRLFRVLPFNLNAEFEFHETNSKVEPHCDLCSLFVNRGRACPEYPKCSRPILSPLYVRTSLVPRHAEKFDDEEKILLRCGVCNLLVHAECYGASYQDASNWVCDRCCLGDFTDAHCCLCQLRGGALKRTTCSRWVHLTCALVSCRMVLLERDTKTLVDISRAQTSNPGKRCSKCSPLVPSSGGDFVMECSVEGCRERLHVSCAHRSKCQFSQNKLNSGKLQVSVKCRTHRYSFPLSSGDRVVAKHKNHRYYRGILQNTYEQVFCSVEFDDGSFSKDTFPEDIQNKRVSLDDHPADGTPVLVKWSDGEIYNATFKGISQTLMYKVEFEDASVLSLEKRHVWPDDDNLPRKVVSRLSEITDTKGDSLAFFEAPETLQKRTRGVNLKPIRDDNFV